MINIAITKHGKLSCVPTDSPAFTEQCKLNQESLQTKHCKLLLVFLQIVQPLQTKHCKLCDHCVAGMDHHCLFLLRCVGQGNHTLFIWFLLLNIVCMLLFLYSVYIYVIQVNVHQSWMEMFFNLLPLDAWLFSLGVLNVVSIPWSLNLLVYQFSLVSNGYTGYFQPEHHDDLLTGYEKCRNIVNFFLNKKPYTINPYFTV